uniref:PiggyBac transposable element-derived protein domain-containing protein n=1 Tax=Clastoptera arizonana TaxID=38151 RepID=A0A1B6CMI5_9HEMI
MDVSSFSKCVQLLKLCKKFSLYMIPYQNLVIDKSLMLWKDWLSFHQFFPKKRKRFGMAIFVLCDSIVYSGRQRNLENNRYLVEEEGLSCEVKTLMKPYSNQNHTLLMDNRYSNPTLFS